MSKRMLIICASLVSFSVLVFAIVSCNFRPPESCAVSGGTADESAFAQHFTQMAVVAEGQVAAEEEGVFNSTDTLEVVAVSLADTATNLCLQERKGGGKIRYNETPTLHEGEDRATLGSFGGGDYVIRVIVDGVLVKNLPFSVR